MEHVQVKIFESNFQCPLLTSEGCAEAPVDRHVWCPQGDNMPLSVLQGLMVLSGFPETPGAITGRYGPAPAPPSLASKLASGSSLQETGVLRWP